MGMSSSAIGRRVSRGSWRTVLPGVYLIAPVEQTFETEAMAACLWGGGEAVVSHRAAAKLWDLGCNGIPDTEISTDRAIRSKKVVVHQVIVPAGHRTSIRGIPVTSIHRTLIDLGDVLDEWVVEDALDEVLRRGMTSREWLLKQIDALGTRGRKGASMLKHLLEEDGACPSWLERRFVRLLAKERLTGYVREHRCGSYRIDFAWLDVKLGVEVHGEKWHRRKRRWSADLARHNWLTEKGWTMLHFDWSQIKQSPSLVVDEIRGTRARLEERLAI